MEGKKKKVCTTCKEEKALEDFHKSGILGKRKTRCKACDRAYAKRYREKKQV